MPWQRKPGAPEGVTKSLAQALLVWSGAPNWVLQSIPQLNTGAEYVNLDYFCSLGPPQQLQAPWDAGSIVFPATLTEYATAKLDERLFAYYCEFPTASGFTCDLVASATLTAGQSDLYLPPFVNADYAPRGPYTHLKVVSLDPDTLNTAFDGFDYTNGVNQGNIYSGRFQPSTPQHGETPFHSGSDKFTVRFHDVVAGGRVQLFECNVGGLTYGPAEIPTPPEGFIGPVANAYPDLDAIGAALDALLIFAMNTSSRLRMLYDQVAPLATISVGDTVAANSGDVLTMPYNTVGCIVTMFNLPLSTDMMFGGPPKLHGAGWATFGNVEGWQLPQELQVSPQLILPIPNGSTKLTLRLRSPATATVSWLRPAGGGA